MEKFVYYKNGIYLVVEREEITKKEFEKDKSIIVGYEKRYSELMYRKSLFGGRVCIDDYRSDFDLRVDGIPILNGDAQEYNLSTELLVSYLNSIETNGVDAFLKNYKESMSAYYNELKAFINDFSSIDTSVMKDSDRKAIVDLFAEKIKAIPTLLGIICILNICMPAALSNEKVLETYESIIESIE